MSVYVIFYPNNVRLNYQPFGGKKVVENRTRTTRNGKTDGEKYSI